MGRVINLDGAGKERKQLTRAIVLALRELAQQTQPDSNTRDLAAFISLSLDSIYQTIDQSVGAWERRGYWLKADRFRMEWVWSEQLGKAMRAAVLVEDWPAVAAISAQVAEKLKDIRLPQRPRINTPWIGAWDKLRKV